MPMKNRQTLIYRVYDNFSVTNMESFFDMAK